MLAFFVNIWRNLCWNTGMNLVRAGHFVVETNQDLCKGWNLDAWNLEPQKAILNSGALNSRNLQLCNLGNLQFWSLGTIQHFRTLPDYVAAL